MTPRISLLQRLLHSKEPFRTTSRDLFHILTAFTKCYCIYHLFTEHISCTYNTWGPSMIPTIGAYGDVISVSKLHRRGKGICVGDVVSFKHPMFPGTGAVKRVVGMPGDFVMRDTPGSGSQMMLQVPEGHCWLNGDNLPESRDSRTYGPLPLALIKGKVIAKIRPFREMKWMENTLQRSEAKTATCSDTPIDFDVA